jgi:hypothetical protein
MSIFKKLLKREDDSGKLDAVKPTLWNYAGAAQLDEEIVYVICLLIDTVGHQMMENWDWDWLKKGEGDFRSLLSRSLMNEAWKLLAHKEWLSLQTTDDTTRKITTIAPLIGLTKLRSLVLQNNLITDLQPLSRMPNLKYLNCFANRITDLAPLESLRLLEELVIGKNPLISLSVLEELGNLQKLSISADQVTCLATCRRLPSLQVLDIYGDELVDNIASFPEMPSLEVLRVSRAQNIAGIERFASLSTLKLTSGNFSSLEGLEKLKKMTHLEMSTSQSISLQPLNQFFALRKLLVTSPDVHDLSALARLPVLHEIQVGGESRHNRAELEALCKGLSSWEEEFRTSVKNVGPSLTIEIVGPEVFSLYDTKEPFGIRPGECEDGMFKSEREWLLGEIVGRLKVNFEEGIDNDFFLPRTTGFRRSERLVLYSLRSYESFCQIATVIQQVLCETRNDWIIYCQSLLDEGPDVEDLPVDIQDFTVWIYPDKIMVTKDCASAVSKLIDWN